jgi:phage-related minor tail protein
MERGTKFALISGMIATLLIGALIGALAGGGVAWYVTQQQIERIASAAVESGACSGVGASAHGRSW